MVKNPPTNAGDIRDMGSILGLGRASGEGNGNPFQYSWTGKSGRLHSIGLQRVRPDWSNLTHTCTHIMHTVL